MDPLGYRAGTRVPAHSIPKTCDLSVWARGTKESNRPLWIRPPSTDSPPSSIIWDKNEMESRLMAIGPDRPTVVVIGAGGSADFGFPSGRSLLLQICNELRQGKSQLRRMLQTLAFPDPEITEFCDELDASQKGSVDAFLEHRPEFARIGKTAIAGVLVPHEREAALGRREKPSWCEYLFHRIARSPEMIEANHLRFITFNYDRSFTHFFYRAMKSSFRRGDQELVDLVRRFDPIHVHGQLSPLDYLDADRGRPYEHDPQIGSEVFQEAAKSIRIVSESMEESDPVLEEARHAVADAALILLVGFGYLEDNIRRIGLDRLSGKVMVAGTAFQFPRGEVTELRRVFGQAGNGLGLGPPDWDALTFLKETGYLSWSLGGGGFRKENGLLV